MDTGFTSFFPSALRTCAHTRVHTHTHTHTLILLFIFLHYSDSLASSFPLSDDLLHCLLATQSNSRQLFLIHSVPGTDLESSVLGVILEQSHLGLCPFMHSI